MIMPDHQILMRAAPREGGATCPGWCGWRRWGRAARSRRTLVQLAATIPKVTLLDLCCVNEAHLTCVRGGCSGSTT